MTFFLLDNIEIKSPDLLSNYAKTHLLRLIDQQYPNLLEMGHPNLNLKKWTEKDKELDPE